MSILQMFKRERHAVAGIVERIGQWDGPSKVHGIVILLQGDGLVYRILRNDNNCTYPAGLTVAGDEVQFESDAAGRVGLSTFTNLTLNARLAEP